MKTNLPKIFVAAILSLLMLVVSPVQSQVRRIPGAREPEKKAAPAPKKATSKKTTSKSGKKKTNTKSTKKTTSKKSTKKSTTQKAKWTQNVSGHERGHAYVDLGLSVKWATCNVGANKPEEYGDYFAWGETKPKSDYSISNSVTYGKDFCDISGNPNYDAARANWGGSWRLPTEAEIGELVEKCTWTWTKVNGVKGCIVKSKVNGNSIFLPGAGYRNGASLDDAGGLDCYWSSTPDESSTQCAYNFLYFNSSDFDQYWLYRYLGQSVRPVFGIADGGGNTTHGNPNHQRSDEIFEAVEQMPQYPGGEAALMADISKNIRYPAMAAENNIQGRVVVQFVVEKNGSVGQVKVVRGKDPDLDKEAMRVCKTLKKFIPAKMNGVNVRMWYSLSINFKLQSNEINGHAYVDLGLGVKWATCNVGADKPEGYGDYFAWGETSAKSNYVADNSATYEKSFGDIGGNSSHDAARARWGGSWRLPTKREIEELVNRCHWRWTTRNGVNGYVVTSKVNGNSIFLPGAGYRLGTSLVKAGSNGYYWCSTPDESDSHFAYSLLFSDASVRWNNSSRVIGLSVRPVSE